MTEHKPECWCRGCAHPHVCGRCRNCICDELRACEQRIGNVISASLVGGYDWRQGYLAGLDAAREAVAAVKVRKDTSYEMRMQALAVIDALREKP